MLRDRQSICGLEGEGTVRAGMYPGWGLADLLPAYAVSHQDPESGASDPEGARPLDARQSRALSVFGHALGMSETLEELYGHVETCVRGLFPADGVVLGVLEQRTPGIRVYVHSEGAQDLSELDARDAAAVSFIEQTLESGRPTKFEELTRDRDPVPEDAEVDEFESGWGSIICAPISSRGNVIGAVAVLSRNPGAYAEDDLGLLVRVGQLLAGTVANILTLQRMEREIQEREVLHEIGRAASSTLDLDEALDGVFEKLDELIPADRVSIVVQPVAPGYIYERGVQITEYNRNLPRRPAPDGLPPLVAATGESILVDDLSAAVDSAPGVRRLMEYGLNSAILAPLVSTGEVVGVLAVCARERSAYSTHDLELLERIALQLTGTIVNSQLHSAVEQQARHEALLAEAGRAATSTTSMESVFAEISRVLATVADFDGLSLSTIDPVRGTMTVRYVVGGRIPGFDVGEEHPLEDSHSGEVISSGSGVIVTGEDLDRLGERYGHLGTFLNRDAIRSRMVIPIFHGEEPVASLSIHSRQPHAYSLVHLNLAEQIAAQISGAIANAILRAELSDAANEEEILAEISRVVTSSPDFDDAFGLVVELIERRLDFERIALGSLDWDTGEARTRYAAGIPIDGFAPGEVNFRSAEALQSRFMSEDGGIFNSVEIANELGEVTEVSAIEAGLVSGMSVHLRSGGTPIGEITVRSLKEDAYGQGDLDFFRRVAVQLSGAFANSELHAEAERRAEEESVLARIGREIGSPLDTGDALESVLSNLTALVPADRLTIAVRNAESGQLEFLHRSGVSVETGHGDDRFAPTDGGLIDVVMSSGAPHVVNDIPHSGEDMPGLSNLADSGLRSVVTMPFIWHSETIGVISISSAEEHAYGERQVALVRRVSDQLAGWVENGRLLASLEQRAHNVAVMAEIGRLVNSSLDLEDVYEQFASMAAQLVPADRIVIATLEEGGTFRERFLYGPGLEHRTSESALPLSGSFTGLVIESGLTLVSPSDEGSNDLVDDLPVLREMVEGGFAAFIGVPLTVQGEVFGVLHFAARAGTEFTAVDRDRAEAVANQIAGGIIGKRLRQEASARAVEESMLAEIGRLVSSSLDVEEIFESIAGLFKRLIPCDRFSVAIYDPSTTEWTPRYVEGDIVGGYEVGERHVDNSVLGRRVAVDQEVMILGGGDDIGEGPLVARFRDAGFFSTLIVPLVLNGETIGALSARSTRENAYSERHAELANRVALQVSGAVANSELHRALLDSEAQTRAVVETAAVGIVTADEYLSIQTINDAVIQIFGYAREELMGEHVSVLAAEPYRSQHRNYEARYHATGDPRIIGIMREVVGRKKDGTTFPLELEVSRVEMEYGITYTGVMRDITDRKRAEERVAELTTDLERRVLERTEQLQETNTELEAFSYTVSHDLRGPLAMSARLASRLLELDENQLPAQARRYVELIARSSDESSRLVADLLNFARLGQQAMNFTDVEPGAVSRAVIEDLKESNPQVEWVINDMPACRADEGLLRVVYMNLLSNAAKFTFSIERPRVELGAIELDDGHALYVRDNGVGFEMDQSERMFEVFERLHRPEDYPGTGAGLAIVRRIVERHGGRIWAESEAGQGATFFFTLPPA